MSFPKWLHSRNPDCDRVLVAAFLRMQGGDCDHAARLIIESIVGDRPVDQQIDALCELIEWRKLCDDAPDIFAVRIDGLCTMPRNLDVYALQRCDEMDAEIAHIADRIAHKRFEDDVMSPTWREAVRQRLVAEAGQS